MKTAKNDKELEILKTAASMFPHITEFQNFLDEFIDITLTQINYNKVLEWLQENMQDGYRIEFLKKGHRIDLITGLNAPARIYFKDRNDATLFRLRW